MEQKKSPEDIFLGLMRDETKDSSLSFDDATKIPLATKLLDRIRQVSELEGTASEQRSSAVSSVVESTTTAQKPVITPAMLQASLRHTFDLSEVGASDSERAELVAESDLLMISGKRRLRLKDEARGIALERAMDTGAFNTTLQQAIADDRGQRTEISRDPVRLPSRWLRRFLSGESPELDTAPPNELRAALEARERLRLVKNLPQTVPSIDDIARRVELAELLEPLRLLIGAEGGWDGSARRDRFVGRKGELRTLRVFVDELSSTSIGESVQRGLARAQTLFGGEKAGIIVIQARGGLGKSTLLAKFVLDHAMAQKRPFPFAYLDFDRAGLDPLRRPQLLIEIAQQVGLQFPQARPELNRLANNIRSEFLGSRSLTAPTGTIRDPYAEFVEIVRNRATFGERAFLLVLDTMEAIQWDSRAMDQLGALIHEFRIKGLDELKVVASGRADVPELRRARGVSTARKNLELEPLTIAEAQEMAEALGSKALDLEWNSSWSSAIAGRQKEVPRREPLAVRVVVDLITRAKAEERQALVDEISADLDANEDFVARVYFKRIVGHVQDELAKKLAWPGLVIRRVTEHIIEEFLGPLCGIPLDRVQDAFNALAREVWMVTREGNALKHRQDLRARTLPLMRNAEPSRFEEIVRKAVDYFGEHKSRSDEDYAEWIYQRLLRGDLLEDVSRDLHDNLLPLLARAAEDFRPETPVASYLASRTATSRLSPSQIHTLQSNDALYHLSRTSASTFALDDVSLDKVTLDVSGRTRAKVDFPSSLNGWALALWIKTGAWQKVAINRFRPRTLNNALRRMYLFWAARIGNMLQDKDKEELLQECLTLFAEEQENLGVRSGVQVMALARIADSSNFTKIDHQLSILLSDTRPDPAPSHLAALRTAIVLGRKSRGPALRLWLAGRRRGSGDRVQTPSFSLAEINALMQLNPEAASAFSRESGEAGASPARFTDAEVVSVANGMIEEMGFWFEEDPNFPRSQPENPRSLALARLFACRDEDWVIPIGYAAERAIGSKLSSALSRRLTFYDRCNREKRGTEAEKDMVANMRNADEAGELAGFAGSVLAEWAPQHRDTKDLRFLLDCHAAWRRAIATVVGSDETSENGSRAPKVGSRATDLVIPAQPQVPSERPPQPGPILRADDPQKGRWGGRSSRDGRQVRVVINSVERDIFFFSVIVESTDWTSLAAPVLFHLHDSFPRSVVPIRRIENGQAVLREWNAYGVFAIGVQVKDAAGRWISLEIDLADAQELPKRFLDR
jgi:hypothetical protein